MPTPSYEVSILTVPNTVIFPDASGKPMVTIDLQNRTVRVDPTVDSDDAARTFWNRVAGVVGQPPLFP